MNRWTKALLGFTILNGVAAVLFLANIINVDDAPGLYITIPFAVVSFGVTLISFAVEQEVAAFDAEQRAHQIEFARDDHSESDDSHHGYGHHAPMRV